MTDAPLPLRCTVTPVKDVRGRVLRHRARCGALEADGATPREARAALADALTRLAADSGDSPVCWWSLDRTTLWILSRGADGWYYRIVNPPCAPSNVFQPYAAPTILGPWPRRQDALNRMEEHYYACEVKPIVEGLLGLFTDRRQWICPTCRNPNENEPPFKCGSPMCGVEFRP